MRAHATPLELELEKPRAFVERLIAWFLGACAVVSVGTTAGIVFVLLRESWGFFKQVGLWGFLGDTQWTPLFAEKHFGVWPLLAGTFLTTIIAVLVAVPFGLLAAVY